MDKQKAQDVLIRAFSKLSPGLRQWQLTILGTGELKETLTELAKRLNVFERLEMPGFVDNPHPYYRTSDIFVLNSRWEGMPMALLEAMSHGLPVIVSDGSPGLLELVENKKTGLIVPKDDIDSLTKALEYLATNVNMRRQLGRSGMIRVFPFKLENVLEQWDVLLGW